MSQKNKRKLNIISMPDLNKARKRNEDNNFVYCNIITDEILNSILNEKYYFIKTYGCQANQRDSEIISGMLEKQGMKKTTDVNQADLILINTCAVRENAEDKVFGEIGILKHLKEHNKDLIICVCGCMVEQVHIVNKLIDTYKHVDLIFGTHDIPKFLDLLKLVINENQKVVNVTSSPGEIYEISESVRESKFKAYVNISYGCNKFCTYCIVPFTRGRERSRKKEDIIKECVELINKGYKEITLLGQNVNSYGKDLYENYDFSNLLEDVAKTSISRLRFLTSHPWDFNDNMINVIAKYDNIMKYVHLPFQSGSSRILKLMNRMYDKDTYLELVKKLRNKMPNLALSTDIIVGFPNETEEDFNQTLDVVRKAKFDSAFTFIYSPRNGTVAARMKDGVSKEAKSKRFKVLVYELEKNIELVSNKLVGTIQKVLVDGTSKKRNDVLSGYTETNKLVNFKGNRNLIGKIVNVKIIESHTYSLLGELLNE